MIAGIAQPTGQARSLPMPFLSPQSPPPQQGYVYPSAPEGTHVISYTYDALYRLTDANYSTGQRFQYAYDAVGNRTIQTRTITSTQVTTYQYDAANRLTNRTESTGQAYTYAWSDRGEMLAEYFQGTPIRTFTYNAAGQLSEATVLTLTTRFRYNGDGQRLSLEVVGKDTTTYSLDYLKSDRILMETTAQTTTLYLYGQSCLGEWTAASGWKYYLQSTLGQVRQAVDDVGNVIYSWAYNPDGTVLQGAQGPITHLECDAVYDWSTGLIYRLGVRYQDIVNCFLSKKYQDIVNCFQALAGKSKLIQAFSQQEEAWTTNRNFDGASRRSAGNCKVFHTSSFFNWFNGVELG